MSSEIHLNLVEDSKMKLWFQEKLHFEAVGNFTIILFENKMKLFSDFIKNLMIGVLSIKPSHLLLELKILTFDCLIRQASLIYTVLKLLFLPLFCLRFFSTTRNKLFAEKRRRFIYLINFYKEKLIILVTLFFTENVLYLVFPSFAYKT